jgi:hypothetical protein
MLHTLILPVYCAISQKKELSKSSISSKRKGEVNV